MMMFQTSKHVPKTEKRCCVFKDNSTTCIIKLGTQSIYKMNFDNFSVPLFLNRSNDTAPEMTVTV